jgi:hypothetical protein
MTKKPILFLILIFHALVAAGSLSYAAGNTGDTLQSGDAAVVSGDYVRVRSGPTLEHRILDKVNSGTEVTVLSRGDKPQKIGESTSYWYQVKIDTGELSGWIYGAFLKKRALELREPDSGNAEPTAPVPQSPAQDALPRSSAPAQLVVLKEIGVIDEGFGPVAAGDLDRNGKPELLFLEKDKWGRYSSLNGYEKSPSGFNKVYSVDMRGSRVGKVDVLSSKTLENTFLAAYSAEERAPSSRASGGRGAGGRLSLRGSSRDPVASLYSYDAGKGALRLVSRLNTPALALGTLDGQNPYLVYLRRNRTPDSDGTVVYNLETSRIETRNGRVTLRDEHQYAKSLPVKKLTLFDLDRDGRDEIIAEIGGRDMGGGIVVLALRDGEITRLVNSGIPTYNNSQFLSLWGADVAGKPQLVVYSTDPSGAGNETSDFGFILASLSEGNLRVDRFCPVNKMLDEVNNGRRVVRFDETGADSSGQGFPFLIIDSEGESNRSSVKKAVL